MLRLSKLADYAIFILVALGRMEGLTNVSGISAATGIPEPTVAKLLKTLTVNKILQSTRGARGGYCLLHPLANLSVARIIEIVDGPVKLTSCCDGSSCLHDDKCNLSCQWEVVNNALRDVLKKVTIADIGNPSFTCPRLSNSDKKSLETV